MIQTKIEANSITTIKDKSMESIVNWFEQHKQSFYILGWSYLSNQQQMEELFYRSIIRVHKELPRLERDVLFEMKVTSIFIQICRELSSDKSLQVSEESEQHQELFKALNQLKEHEKEVVVLTYIKGLSQEDAAQLVKVSIEKMKEHLFSGIQSLRNGMGDGSGFNGCKEYHDNYIDFFERTLERPKKIDFEKHIYHCQDCQEDLATFQDTMLTISNLAEGMDDFRVPSDFMENVKARLAEKEKHRQQKNKKRLRLGLVFVSVFVLLMGLEFFTRSFSNLYYSWTEEDQELRAFLQQDLGENLNLEAESDGVKIKIKSAIADDIQTLIFYEIEDTQEDNQYVMNYHDGISVENEYKIMRGEVDPGFYIPDLESDINNEKKNVYHGKISLRPLDKDKGTIKLKITKLYKLLRDPSDRKKFNGFEMEFTTGEWNFEIPVTKQPSTEYALDEETEVEGIPIRFEKLTIAPTTTVLQYAINIEQQKKHIQVLNFDDLELNNKKVKADMYGSSFVNSQQDMNWTTFQTHYEPVYGEKPKEVNVHFKSVQLMIEDQKTIELEASREYPQTFEYAGSTISIDKVEIGQPSKVVISNHEIKNRAFESLHFNIVGEDENDTGSMEMNSEGVFVDKNGVEYEVNENPVSYEEIEQPRYFFTVESMVLHSNNAGVKVIPKRLEIFGYNTTKYLDDVVKIFVD